MKHCINTIIFRDRSTVYKYKFFIQMDQQPKKLHKKVKRSPAQQYRIMVAQKVKKLMIARNQRDGVQKDFSVISQERRIQNLKQRYPEASMTKKIQLYNAKRRSEEDALIKKKQLQKQRLEAYGLAHVKIIMQDYPDIMRQSIEYLTNLADKAQLSAFAKNAINKTSIAQYYTQLFTKGATKSFYRHSTGLINQRILEIIQEFHKSQNKYPPQMNIQIQILAHFFKNILQFQRYFPNQVLTHTLHLNMTVLTQILNLTTEQISQLRNIYISHSPNITYLEDFNLRPLANAYYFIMLKQKMLLVKYSLQLEYEIKKDAEKLKIHRAQAMEKEKFNTEFNGEEVQCQSSLSELYARIKMTKKDRVPRKEELLQKIQTYERQIELQNLKKIIENLEGKRITKQESVGQVYFKRYQRRKNTLEKNDYKLNKLKDKLITKQLIQDPYCSYEQVFSNIYNRNGMYIEWSYFDGNIHRLLEKEAHYQQLRYLEKVFKRIIQRKEKANVLFIDRCNLIEDGESSVIMAVSLTGDFYCKVSPDSIYYLLEVKEYLQTQQSSIVLLFDDEFPLSALEATGEAFMIRKTHSLYFLPRVSLVPNPCMAIANSLKQAFTEQCSLEEALHTMFEEFNRPRVMEVAQEEWEKAQRLAYPDDPQSNQQSEANKDEGADQNIEEGSNLEEKQDEDENGKEVQEADEDLNEDKNENMNEDNNEEAKFPRQNKQGFSSPNSQPLIMENLSERSVSQLQSTLTRLHQLNRSISKNP